MYLMFFLIHVLIDKLKGEISIGHNRYGTTGESALKNVQPLFSELNFGGIAIAHNGNLTNTQMLKHNLLIQVQFFSPHRIQKLYSIYFQHQRESLLTD